MANSRESSLRLNAQSIIQSIITDSSRVTLGLSELGASSTFFSTMVADGPYAIVLPTSPEDDFDGQNRHFKITFSIIVYFGIAGDTSDDFVTIENTCVDIRNALFTQSNWVSNPPPDSGHVGKPTPRSDLKPGIHTYQIDLTFWGSMEDAGSSGPMVSLVEEDYTGTSTDSFVTVFDRTPDMYGLYDIGIEASTPGADLEYRVTAYDIEGGSSQGDDSISDTSIVQSAVNLSGLGSDILGVTRVKVEVKSANTGVPSAYAIKLRGFEA